MKEVKLSIIVPVFNVENYLCACLDSLIVQDLKEIEIICVDDGSTDGSPYILKEYEKKYKNIIRVIKKQNGGQSSARNQGLKLARGKYLAFVDSDDLWANSGVASYIIQSMEKENLDLLIFGIQPFYESRELEIRFNYAKGYYHSNKSYGCFENGYELFCALKEGKDYLSSVCVKVIKREVVIRARIKFYEGIIHEDELFSFILLMSVHKCCHTDKVMYLRRFRHGSTMTSRQSFSNLYGSYLVWKESVVWLHTNKISKKAEEIAGVMLREFEKMIKRFYSEIEPEERIKIKNLDFVDQYLLSKFIEEKFVKNYACNPFAFPYHLVSMGSRVILYGAGDVGQHMWSQIQEEQLVVPVCVLDRNAEKIKLNYVYPVDDVVKKSFDYIVISIKDEHKAKTAKHTLIDMGIKSDIIKWDGDRYDADKFQKNVMGALMGRV